MSDLFSNKVTVNTNFCADYIEQTIDYGQDTRKRVVQQIINLQDDGVRKALIKLGWTPPER